MILRRLTEILLEITKISEGTFIKHIRINFTLQQSTNHAILQSTYSQLKSKYIQNGGLQPIVILMNNLFVLGLHYYQILLSI